MVVATGGWAKNVTLYPTPPQNNAITPLTSTMTAKAVLTRGPNSHPFQERTLCLEQPVKVGRSVAKEKAAPDNAIFDCKVLSRHHALLWFDSGKFYLQDTKSSNGTFVNSCRLHDSEPHEVSSGDTVQFGVDVVENNRKVTHGCIVAVLKLFLPDGREAKGGIGMVPLGELYKLNQIIQEAARREQCLEIKLSALQNYTEEVKTLVDYTWQVRVDEERLLSRVATLEKQLQICKNNGDDRLREEITKLKDNKIQYQEATKELLEKLHTQKLEAEDCATERDRQRETAEQETELARKLLVQAQTDLEDIAKRLVDEQQKALKEQAAFKQREAELEAHLEGEKRKICELEDKLREMLDSQNSFKEMDILKEMEKSSNIYNEDYLQDSDLKYKENGGMLQDSNHLNSTHATPTTGNDNHDETNKRVSFSLLEKTDEPSQNGSPSPEKSDATPETNDDIDSKTLRHQYQHELRKQVEQLEAAVESSRKRVTELEEELGEARRRYEEREALSNQLKAELLDLQQRLKESSNECRRLQDRYGELSAKGVKGEERAVQTDDGGRGEGQLADVEEELVLVKERYAALVEENVALSKKLNGLRDQYNNLCNRSYNTMFFYVAPLVLMVLYLLISSITS